MQPVLDVGCFGGVQKERQIGHCLANKNVCVAGKDQILLLMKKFHLNAKLTVASLLLSGEVMAM
jgi:hypothetical protein